MVADAVVLAVLHEHRRERPGWRRLPEVVRHRVTFGRPVYQKPTATNVACRRVGHRQRERCRDRRINRVAPVPHDLCAHPRRQTILRHHHRQTRPDRLRTADKQNGDDRDQEGGHGDAHRNPSDHG